jgi:hypothetical protein
VDNAVSERSGETTRLGSFEIVRKLARGGMAEIFLARTRGPSGFEKLVVLKKILPKYAGKQRFVQLFLDEAKLAASLDHPNIAQVYDIGTVDGSYFFTMEYLHGQDVRSILHRTWRTGDRFPIEHAVQIARHVASALHFAHEKQRADGTLLGIVHRDVSPSNIIVTYDGATKLLDFGVAKTTASTVKTRTGALKGKVAYMSPEQARGAPVDRRSDIFALGIVLWEMVTTQRLYRGENDLATLQLIITHPPRRPTALRPECPIELERIVLRALADDPGARYATAEELVTDLDELAREHKLKQSSNALAATLGQLFGDELAAWREARAAGVPLAEHLHGVGDLTTPVSESDFVEVEEDLDELELDDGDDDELTEHAAPIVEPLPALPSGLLPALPPRAPLPALPPPPHAMPHATPLPPPPHAMPRAPVPALPPALPIDRLSATTLEPLSSTMLDPLSSTVLEPAASLANPPGRADLDLSAPSLAPPDPELLPMELDNTVLSPSTAMTRGHPQPSAAFASGTRRRPTPGVPFTPAGPQLTPSAAFPAIGARPPGGPQVTPSAAFPAIGARPPSSVPLAPLAPPPLSSMPLATLAPPPPSSVPFAVPPWQSGQPAAPAGAVMRADALEPDRAVRPWSIVALPPFDPEMFERQRRLVLRVSGGLVGFIILLAILAGRC